MPRSKKSSWKVDIDFNTSEITFNCSLMSPGHSPKVFAEYIIPTLLKKNESKKEAEKLKTVNFVVSDSLQTTNLIDEKTSPKEAFLHALNLGKNWLKKMLDSFKLLHSNNIEVRIGLWCKMTLIDPTNLIPRPVEEIKYPLDVLIKLDLTQNKSKFEKYINELYAPYEALANTSVFNIENFFNPTFAELNRFVYWGYKENPIISQLVEAASTIFTAVKHTQVQKKDKQETLNADSQAKQIAKRREQNKIYISTEVAGFNAYEAFGLPSISFYPYLVSNNPAPLSVIFLMKNFRSYIAEQHESIRKEFPLIADILINSQHRIDNYTLMEQEGDAKKIEDLPSYAISAPTISSEKTDSSLLEQIKEITLKLNTMQQQMNELVAAQRDNRSNTPAITTNEKGLTDFFKEKKPTETIIPKSKRELIVPAIFKKTSKPIQKIELPNIFIEKKIDNKMAFLWHASDKNVIRLLYQLQEMKKIYYKLSTTDENYPITNDKIYLLLFCILNAHNYSKVAQLNSHVSRLSRYEIKNDKAFANFMYEQLVDVTYDKKLQHQAKAAIIDIVNILAYMLRVKHANESIKKRNPTKITTSVYAEHGGETKLFIDFLQIFTLADLTNKDSESYKKYELLKGLDKEQEAEVTTQKLESSYIL